MLSSTNKSDVLRRLQVELGKIGQGPFAWYGVHSALGSIGYIALLYFFAFMLSISVNSGWVFYAVAAAGYITLCERSLREFFWLLLFVLGIRR